MVDRLQAVAELVREASPAMTPLQRMRGLQGVFARRDAGRRKRRVLMVLSTLSACGIVAAGAIALVALRDVETTMITSSMTSSKIGMTIGTKTGSATGEADDPNPLSYRVENGEIAAGGYLRSFGGGEVSLRFAEHTELRLAAGARGRLTNVGERGARFAIEQGEAQVSVTPRPGARWLIDAGPFLITVHGTVFSAAWDGGTERLDIKMKNGLVSVTGPVADGAIAVHGGQRLIVNVQHREVLLRPNEQAEPSEQAGARDRGMSRPANRAGEDAGTETHPTVERRPAIGVARSLAFRSVSKGETGRSHAINAPSRSWTATLASGDLEGILREAEQRGLHRSLAEARSEDLAALADAARYLRHEDIARQALIAQRDRFPRSDRARDAAFLLGRLSETGADGNVRALSWYNRYLSEAPGGAYASEALGRKMTATEKLNGLSSARDVAREYLQRFPHGTYAGAARAMSDAP